MSNLKKLMVNGIFGENNRGDAFVIVNDHMVYQDGEFDDVPIMAERNKDDDHRVAKLVKGVWSFKQYKNGHGEVIYKEDTSKDKKEIDKMLNELDELLKDIEKDARSQGMNEKEAKAAVDVLLMAASAAAFKEVMEKNFGKD